MSNGLNPFLKSFTFCAENISQVDLQPFSHFYSLNWIRYPWACVPSVDSWIARQSSSLCLALLHCCIAFRGRMKSWEVTDGEKCCVCSCICSPSECLHRWDYIERQTQICRAMKALRRHKATPGTYLTVLVKRVLFCFFHHPSWYLYARVGLACSSKHSCHTHHILNMLYVCTDIKQISSAAIVNNFPHC